MKRGGIRKKNFRQGIANLKLEGMSLTFGQQRIARLFQTGKITRAELIEKAAAYARSR